MYQWIKRRKRQCVNIAISVQRREEQLWKWYCHQYNIEWYIDDFTYQVVLFCHDNQQRAVIPLYQWYQCSHWDILQKLHLE